MLTHGAAKCKLWNLC